MNWQMTCPTCGTETTRDHRAQPIAWNLWEPTAHALYLHEGCDNCGWHRYAEPREHGRCFPIGDGRASMVGATVFFRTDTVMVVSDGQVIFGGLHPAYAIWTKESGDKPWQQSARGCLNLASTIAEARAMDAAEKDADAEGGGERRFRFSDRPLIQAA